MLHTKFQDHSVLEKKIFKSFYHIWTWQPSWSCDLICFYKFESRRLIKAQYVNLLQSASGQKMFKINEICVTLDKAQRKTLTSGTCISPCTHLVYYVYQPLYHRLE